PAHEGEYGSAGAPQLSLRNRSAAADARRRVSGMDDGEDKGFLSRWSERKAQARRREIDAAAAPEQPGRPEPSDNGQPDSVDPASLPSLEDLNEASDFTPFLQKGVPETLRKAALRKL